MAYQFSYTWAQIISRVINAMQKGVDYVTAGRLAGSTLGTGATAEGSNNTASGANSHAGGQYNVASGTASIAMGAATTASAGQATALGSSTTASGGGAIATGMYSEASGNQSVTLGIGTAATRRSQFAFGEYNTREEGVKNTRGQYMVIAGNGEDDTDRSNAMTLDWEGNEVLSGKLTIGADPSGDMDVVPKKMLDAVSITDTASGSIASFSDGADGIPMRSVKASIEPVQDLHGYANPWPAGGGKNKLPAKTLTEIQAVSAPGTWSGDTYTYNGISFKCNFGEDGLLQTITVNGTATDQAVLWFYPTAASNFNGLILNGCPSGGSIGTYALQAYDQTSGQSIHEVGNGYTLPFTNGDMVRLIVRIWSGATLNNVVFKPMLRLATETDSTFAPYSNICPISGWTGAEITRTGKNLLSGYYASSAINESGVRYTSRDSTLTHIVRVEPGATYKMSGTKTAQNTYIQKFDQYGGYLGYQRIGSSLPVTFTVPSKTYWVYVQFNVSGAGAVLPENGQLELGSTATDYEAYNGTVYPISWQTEAGEVYGGYFVVNEDGSVDLTVAHGYVDLGTLNGWYKNAGGGGTYSWLCKLSAVKPNTSAAESPDFVCSSYATITGSEAYNGTKTGITLWATTRNIAIHDDAMIDFTAAQVKAALSGVYLVYELDAPSDPIHLDSIGQITSLLGSNNVWSNTGDTEVTYVADPKLYIQKVIA